MTPSQRLALMRSKGLDFVKLASRLGCTIGGARRAIEGTGTPYLNRRMAAVFQMSEFDLFGTEPQEVPIITDHRWSKLGENDE